jgi:hypothetical protein
MVSSAIWNKFERVSFQRAQIALAPQIYSNLYDFLLITYTKEIKLLLRLEKYY